MREDVKRDGVTGGGEMMDDGQRMVNSEFLMVSF